MLPTGSEGGYNSAGDDTASVNHSLLSMYNADTIKSKHVYSTKSLIPSRYKYSPYVDKDSMSRSPSKVDKPWRKNMSNLNNNHFIEQKEQN